MKLNHQDLVSRASLVAAQLRGTEKLPESPTPFSEAVAQRSVSLAASEAVSLLVQERAKGGQDSFAFQPRVLLNRAVDATTGAPGSFWRGMSDEILAPRLEQALHDRLSLVGLEADIRFRQQRDGESVVQLVHIRPRALPGDSQREMERVTQGPTASAVLNPQPVLTAAHKILEGVADKLAALGPELRDPLYRGDVGASTTRKVTAELEKAAQQLSLVSKMNVDQSTPESRAVQKAYVKLLSALSDPESYYRGAQLVDDDVRSFKAQKHGVLSWISGVLASPERLKSGGFEARIQAALGKIYEQAPLFSAPTRGAPPEAFLRDLFPLLPPSALRDAATAHLMINLGRSEEAARTFELGGDTARAAAARRHQAYELAVVFGPSLVTGDALARHGDHRSLANNLGDAAFAYAGALRCYKGELSPDHWLVRDTAAKLEHAGAAWLKKLDPDGARPLDDYPKWAAEWVERTNKELGVAAILGSTHQVDRELPFVAQRDDWAEALRRETSLDPPYRWTKKTSAELQTLSELRSAIYGPLPGPDRPSFF